MRALRYEIRRPKGKTPHIEFEVFTPNSEKEVPRGTVARGNATCPACERVLPVERVRVQLRKQRGGADTIFDADGNRIGGARLLAVVTLKDDKAGRQYRVATDRDYEAVWKAQKAVAKLAKEKLPNGLSVIPDEPTPAGGGSGAGRAFSVQNYGMMQFGDLFTARQKLALTTLAGIIGRVELEAVRAPLAFALSKQADFNSSLARWANHMEKSVATFGRQALPILWDWCEATPLGGATGALGVAIDWICSTVRKLSGFAGTPVQVQEADACKLPLPDDAAAALFTDPPYYDAVPYADLSDFFYVWLKRALPEDPLTREPLTPKECEIVQDETKRFDSRPKDRAFFEERMALAFAEGRRVLRDDGIGSVVFAHKTTEGWEALLSGMIKGGWTVSGSWPVTTEKPQRMRAQDSAALGSSVHLVCRPRPEDAPIGDWADVFRELPDRIGDWMERLSSEGVRGADLVFACIGPAMEIYSRYSRVEDAEGREIPLGGNPEATEPYKRGFLAYVWEIVSRTALEQVLGTAEARARNGAAGALEEDARLTALFLWTHQSTSLNGAPNAAGAESSEEDVSESADEDDDEASSGATKRGLTLIYDVVRRFCQPLGIHLDTWNGRIIETKKGIVRLLPVKERAEQLLGKDGASGVADMIERSRGEPIQLSLLEDDRPRKTGRRGGTKSAKSAPDEAPTLAPGTTTLDRVHIAMLLQASGKSNALRTMLKAEAERGPDFFRLANALSALYPRDSEEKRLLDAMLLAAPK